VSTDPKMVSIIQLWPLLKTLKQLQGFSGLIGYYKRLNRKYRVLSLPLTNLLKKEQFICNSKAHITSGKKKKKAMVIAPILVLLEYEKPFIVETDAYGMNIGAVLMQEGNP